MFDKDREESFNKFFENIELNRLKHQQSDPRYQDQKDRAVFETSENIAEINGRVQSINNGLDKEREDRAQADIELKKHTDKQDRRNFILGVIAAVCGVIGIVIALASLVVAIFKP